MTIVRSRPSAETPEGSVARRRWFGLAGGWAARAAAVVAVACAAAGGLTVVAAPPAHAAETWSGSFDEHRYHVTGIKVSASLNRIENNVRKCGGDDPCTAADPTGKVVGVRGENISTFTYAYGGATSSFSINRDQRDLPIAYSFPTFTGTSERMVRTIRGDAYRRFTDANGIHRVDVRYYRDGTWRWVRFDRDRIDAATDGAVFQYNQVISRINAVEQAELAITGVSVLGAGGELLIAASRKLNPVTAVWMLCGIAASMCTAARVSYTSSDASGDAAAWLFSHGYGFTPTSGT